MDSFYYTLQSNASKDFYPLNKPTNFKIHLPKRIDLDGVWVVALVEILFPARFEFRKRKVMVPVDTLPPKKPKLDMQGTKRKAVDDIAPSANKKFKESFNSGAVIF